MKIIFLDTEKYFSTLKFSFMHTDYLQKCLFVIFFSL
jgi:hypothetical protein